MKFEVYTTGFFEKQFKKLAKRHPSLKLDVINLSEQLETDPMKGTSLGKDCYKIRLSIKSKGRGKSGGARVITCVKVVNASVFLLSIYDKGDKANLEDGELNKLLLLLELENPPSE